MTEPSVEARLGDLEIRVRALESRAPLPSGPRTTTPHATPREFLLEKKPRTDNDKILAIGYYLEMILREESFDFDRLYAVLGQAKEPVPANRRDPPYQNVKKGFFREVGKREAGMKARNRWALTNTGIARVEAGFK